MNTVKVYRWKKFDLNCNEYKIGPCMATRQAIKSFGGAVPIVPIEEIETEVDDSVLDGNGMTPPGWVPK
jgi:hypothetical protein